jgi:hypothetical protein
MTTITLDVPDQLAKRLKKFEPTVLIEVLRKVLDMLDLLTSSQNGNPGTSQETWQREWTEFCNDIQDLPFSQDEETMVNQLCDIRHEIFEEEYAYLYR